MLNYYFKILYHLRQMRSMRRSLSVDAAKTLINAFITSRIDYCNSVFSRVAVIHLRPLHSVLNAAARLIVKKRKYDPITATIRDVLHYLTIQQRIEYKLCDLVHKAMHHTAPVYLTELHVLVSIHQGRANLRSARHGDLSVAANKGTTYGSRSFAVSGTTTSNVLSLSIREQYLSLGQFRSRLNTELFNRAYYVV